MSGSNRGVLSPLRREHKELMLQLGMVMNAVGSCPPSSTEKLGTLIEALGARLETHLNHEQESLCGPLVSALGKDGPVGPIMDGHKAMKRAVKDMSSALAAYRASRSPRAWAELREKMDSLHRTVGEYVRKEEKVVFWIAELTL
jgi:iron-sulfur cluster repair protein YtfE (RIC family)